MTQILIAVIAAVLLQQPLHAQERVLRHQISIHSTLDKAWRAMTTVEGLKAWNVRDAVIELKTMGKYHTHYNGKVGDAGTVASTVLSYIPRRMLATRLGIPDNFMVPDEKGQRVSVPEVIKAGTLFSVSEFDEVSKRRNPSFRNARGIPERPGVGSRLRVL